MNTMKMIGLMLVIVAMSACSNNGSECKEGDCCDENGNYKISGTKCAEIIEYRCLETCGGMNRQYRISTKTCSGISADCEDESFSPAWIHMSDCADNEACGIDNDGIVQCVECGINANCDDGKCSCNEGYDLVNGICQDLCNPNPCIEDFRTVCVSEDGNFVCQCDVGYELVDDVCQEICEPRCGDYSTCIEGFCTCDFSTCFDTCCSEGEVCRLKGACDNEIRLTGSSGSNEDFGRSVSISGDVAIVGAPDNDAGVGAAYIFQLENGEWVEKKQLTASDAHIADYFGSSVSISGDLAIVGAAWEDGGDDDPLENSGAAYIFQLESGEWVEKKKLTASDAQADDWFGYSVSISGEIAIVGVPKEDVGDGDPLENSGAAYIFQLENGEWVEKKQLTAPDAQYLGEFGYSVSINGEIAIVGTPKEDLDDGDATTSAGAAYIFHLENDQWVQKQKLTASDAQKFDGFGNSVSIHGDLVIVGASDEDGGEGDPISAAGAAYIFQLENDQWVQKQKIAASDAQKWDNFGESVSIYEDVAVVGAVWEDGEIGDPDISWDGPGAAYLFKLENGLWVETQKLVIPDAKTTDNFGYSVSLYGDVAIIGTKKAEAAYIY